MVKRRKRQDAKRRRQRWAFKARLAYWVGQMGSGGKARAMARWITAQEGAGERSLVLGGAAVTDENRLFSTQTDWLMYSEDG